MPVSASTALRGSDSPESLQKWASGVDDNLREVTNRIAFLTNRHAILSTTVATIGVTVGLPNMPTSCSLSATGVIRNGLLFQEVTATYTSPNPVGNFAGIFIVVQNYKGSSQLVKFAEDTYHGPGATTKSFKFTMEKTGETITVFFVPKNSQEGSFPDWTIAPNTTLALTAGIGSIVSTLPTNSNSPVNINATLTGGSPLTQSGTSTQINVAAFTLQFGFGTLSYNSGSVDPGVYGSFYVYFDDGTYAGGAVTYHTSTTGPTLTGAESRFFLGSIKTTAGGGGGGSGGHFIPPLLP